METPVMNIFTWRNLYSWDSVTNYMEDSHSEICKYFHFKANNKLLSTEWLKGEIPQSHKS